jgi:hypothetical protein
VQEEKFTIEHSLTSDSDSIKLPLTERNLLSYLFFTKAKQSSTERAHKWLCVRFVAASESLCVFTLSQKEKFTARSSCFAARREYSIETN